MVLSLLALLVTGPSPLVEEVQCPTFTLIATSPSGEWINDDAKLSVRIRDVTLPVALPPSMPTWMGERPTAAALRPLTCRERLVAWDLGGGKVVVLLSRSGRPQLDWLNVVLLDVFNRKVLDAVETKFEVNPARTFFLSRLGAGGGVEVRAVREYLGGDDSAAAMIEDWLSITVRKDRLALQWSRK